MADLIESLEGCIDSAANEALRLRNNVIKIDQVMRQVVQAQTLGW